MSEIMDLNPAILHGLTKLKYDNIRPDQRKIVESYLTGKDAYFCSQTGSGKSLTFEIAPFAFQYMQDCERNTEHKLKPIVLVISPLSSLMKSQVEKLGEKEVNAVYLKGTTLVHVSSLPGKSNTTEISKEKFSIKDISSLDTDILFSSPESLLGSNRQLMMELASKGTVKTIFVDEAHCIKKYGKSDKRKAAYRPYYGKIGEIRSLFGPGVPVVALTATATKETKAAIFKDLCLTNCTDVTRTPDKRNITYWIKDFPKGDICEHFDWLVAMLQKLKENTPRMIIFFRQIKYISEVYEHLVSSLGKDAYINYNENGPNDDRNRLFDMFHLKTDDEVKDSICSSYHIPEGNIRIVLASTSFSMGLDVKCVEYVIHYGPANDIDDYVQETGRAGRDPSQQCHAILLKYKRCLNSQNITSQMKNYVKSSECRRCNILSYFSSTIEELTLKHNCCDICRQICVCDQDNEACDHELPDILNIMNTTEESDISDDSSESPESSGSDVDSVRKKPQVIYDSESD